MSVYLKANYTGDAGSIHWKFDLVKEGATINAKNLRRVGTSRSLIEVISVLGSSYDLTQTLGCMLSDSGLENGTCSAKLTAPDNTKYDVRASGQTASLFSGFVAAGITKGATTQLDVNSAFFTAGTDKWDAEGKTGPFEIHMSGNFSSSSTQTEFSQAIAEALNYP